MRPRGEISWTRRTLALLVLSTVGLQIAGTSPVMAAGDPPYGPRRSITCPADSVEILPGSDIQAAVNAHPEGTAFCLRAGLHHQTGPITPKTGNSFTGEYGAIIDGSGWSSDDPNQGLFRAHNQDIDRVVIRNLVIRNSPQRGIHAFRDHSDRWIIEHNDIQGNRVGIVHGNFFQIRRNLIRGNWQYGIGGFRSTGSVIERNRFTRNAERFRSFPGDSGTSKWAQVTNTVIRHNIVVDNFHTGIWFDGGHRGIRIVRNIVRRNGANGIFSEVGGSAIIRRNTVTGHQVGIYISESRHTTVRRNRLANNDRAIWLFQDGNRRHESELRNNRVVRNLIRVPRQPIVPGIAPMATGLSCSNLSMAQCRRYSTQRGNSFHRNGYTVPHPKNRYWGVAANARTWREWRAAGQDLRGRLRAG
jgi:parallel beta-helix repeat protein